MPAAWIKRRRQASQKPKTPVEVVPSVVAAPEEPTVVAETTVKKTATRKTTTKKSTTTKARGRSTRSRGTKAADTKD